MNGLSRQSAEGAEMNLEGLADEELHQALAAELSCFAASSKI